MARKTVSVESVVDEINRMLRESTCSPEARFGMCQAVQTVLSMAGRYSGFRYLTADEVPAGHKPGINWDAPHDNQDARYPDESRRQYGVKMI